MKGKGIVDNVDTVTPLDGDGSNVVGLDEQFENVKSEDYETKGQTTVATRDGYRFVPSDKSIPVITSQGIKVTKDQAEALSQESDGLVSIHNDNQEG